MAAVAEGQSAARGASRSWMLLHRGGSETMLDVDKHAIMHRAQIDARDLRILDPLLSYPSAILGREHAIVLNLEHIKAIVTAEEVLLRDPLDERIIPIVEDLRRHIRHSKNNQVQSDENENLSGENNGETSVDDELPFEIRVLEVALEAVCSFLDARATELEAAADPTLDALTIKVSSRSLDRVRKLKSAMTRLTTRVQKVRDELEQLLDDDGDMAELCLSRKIDGMASPASLSGAPVTSPAAGSKMSRASKLTSSDESDVEELEMLLEAYFTQIDSTLNKLSTLREYIDSTEDYINIQLDNHRNRLIQMELFLNAAGLSLSFYSFIAGVFGMNIPFSWNDGHGYIFKWVLVVSGIISLFVFGIVTHYARHKGLIGS